MSVALDLSKANTFVDAARMFCDETKRAGANQTCVLLLGMNGPPILAIDNFSRATDDYRRYLLTWEYWERNPVLVALRRDVRAVAHYTGDALAEELRHFGLDGGELDVLAMPIFGASGWCACAAFTLRRDRETTIEGVLAIMSTHLSVWCTQHGIGMVPKTVGLGPRQHRIAELAAQGAINSEIAEVLAISINTVKSRLKEVFARLAVRNRTELAHVMRALTPLHGIPPGITRYKSVTVTCAGRARAKPRRRRANRASFRVDDIHAVSRVK